jgi:hypothetical protein
MLPAVMEHPMTDPLTGVCNFLMSRDNVAIGGIPAGMTTLYGNWVGGRFELTQTAFTFSMNKMNKAFQKDTGAVVIPRTAIRRATKGSMMFFFTTVDLDTDLGKFRIRSTPKGTRNLLAALGAAP